MGKAGPVWFPRCIRGQTPDRRLLRPRDEDKIDSTITRSVRLLLLHWSRLDIVRVASFSMFLSELSEK